MLDWLVISYRQGWMYVASRIVPGRLAAINAPVCDWHKKQQEAFLNEYEAVLDDVYGGIKLTLNASQEAFMVPWESRRSTVNLEVALA